MDIKITGELDAEEVEYYRIRAISKFSDKQIESMHITVDGDYVDIEYKWKPIPFERIRRITGYLVGTTARWNDAKKAEEQQRVKHGVKGAS